MGKVNINIEMLLMWLFLVISCDFCFYCCYYGCCFGVLLDAILFCYQRTIGHAFATYIFANGSLFLFASQIIICNSVL